MEKVTFGAGCFRGVEHVFAEVPPRHLKELEHE